MNYERLHKHLLEKQFSDDPFCSLLGMHIDHIEKGAAQLSLTVDHKDLNLLDVSHGGVYFALADTTAGTALDSYGYSSVTAGCDFHFFRSAHEGDRMIARAETLKHGKTLSVFQVKVTNQDDVLLCAGSFTYYNLGEPLLPEAL